MKVVTIWKEYYILQNCDWWQLVARCDDACGAAGSNAMNCTH
jgi:hypothetical protein